MHKGVLGCLAISELAAGQTQLLLGSSLQTQHRVELENAAIA